jgi:hypothetical protein
MSLPVDFLGVGDLVKKVADPQQWDKVSRSRDSEHATLDRPSHIDAGIEQDALWLEFVFVEDGAGVKLRARAHLGGGEEVLRDGVPQANPVIAAKPIAQLVGFPPHGRARFAIMLIYSDGGVRTEYRFDVTLART